MNRELWIKADAPSDKQKRKDLVTSALECGIKTAIVRPEDSDFSDLGNIDLIFIDNNFISDKIKYAELKSPKDQDEVLALAGKCDVVILGTSDWTVIPLENMIAGFRDSGTKIMSCASDAEQAKLYFQTLEKGVDGVVIDVPTGNDIRKFVEMFRLSDEIELATLEVTDIRNIEMGDRVCVDTVSMMVPGEGMLVGSQASCLFLIQSECEDNGYVAARPFRVNAGAVHAYVMGPEGRTRYLSELRSGDPIVLVSSDGGTRTSCVGRCKVERRPLVIMKATDGTEEYTTILQNAETVKIVGPEGSISISKIKKGDKVLAKLESGGRHFGMKVDETIKEV